MKVKMKRRVKEWRYKSYFRTWVGREIKGLKGLWIIKEGNHKTTRKNKTWEIIIIGAGLKG